MPCRKADHNHEWPSTGTFAIFPCETICCLCDSTKEYKPASALRKHVQTHIKNDRLPLSLLRSTSGRPKLSSSPFTLHRQVAVVQAPTAEEEPQGFDVTPISSSQQVIQGSPASGGYACFDTTATLPKHLHESHQASCNGPALLPTTAASSIADTSVLGVEQSPTPGASEFDAPLDVPGGDSAKEMRIWTTSAAATHDYMKTSPNSSTLSYLPPSSRASGPLHSRQIEQLRQSFTRIRI